MTWGVPAAPSPSPRGSPDPSGASAFRGIEWGLGALATEGGGMGEGMILADLGALALGVMATAGSTNEHVGFGLHLAGGPRFRLAEGIRLDGLVDLGFVLFGGDHKDSGFFGSSETSGSDQVLPAVGARLGVTFTSATSGWYLSLGPAIRRVPRTTVEYTTTDCFFLGACSTKRRTATYGGTIAGGFLTFGQASRRR